MTTETAVRICDDENNRLEIRIPADPAINCGRRRTHADGGFYVQPDLDDPDTIIQHDDGSGLTAMEAERVLDSLDNELSRSK